MCLPNEREARKNFSHRDHREKEKCQLLPFSKNSVFSVANLFFARAHWAGTRPAPTNHSAFSVIFCFGNNILDSVESKNIDLEFTPNKLVSLLDMLRFYAHEFSLLVGYLASVEQDENFESFDWDDLKKNLDELDDICAKLGLRLSVRQIARLRSNAINKEASWLQRSTFELRARIYDELETSMFLVFDGKMAEYFDNPKLFGEKVIDAFPSSGYDIEEAGNCLALDRPTACVFHLMRALEKPLRLLGEELGITDTPNWNKCLQEIDKLFKDIRDQKIPKPQNWKSQREPFYSEASALLRNVKNAWRNDAAHNMDKKYTPDEAVRIYHAVKGFMEFLAEHLKEEQKEQDEKEC